MLLTGTWSSLANAMPSGADVELLLPDGSVMVHGGGGNTGTPSAAWYKLTPDSSGSYANGTWSTLASMHVGRQFFGSVVLPDGDVMVVGGEYSTSGGQDSNKSVEIYDPIANAWSWSTLADFPASGGYGFGEDNLEVLPDGTVLGTNLVNGQTFTYNINTNSWNQVETKVRNDPGTEESWVKLPNGHIVSYDVGYPYGEDSFHGQYYDPSAEQWVDANVDSANPPSVLSSNNGDELGPGILLPDGRAWFLGADGNTAFYAPSTNTWFAGPQLPVEGTTQYTSNDEPAAMLPNGNVLVALSPKSTSGYAYPTHFYEYNPITNTFTQTPSGAPATPNYYNSMLVLPTGQVLLSTYNTTLTLYTPSGSPQSSWQPSITSISANGNGTYTLTGTQLNGISEGAEFGDDRQMAENYPIVQLTTASGIYYARSYNWSSTGVATGSLSETVQFVPPANVGSSFTSVKVIAGGISSTPFPMSTAPTAPSNLSAVTASSSQINLTWTDTANDETAFQIIRATDAGFQNAVTITTTNANTTYNYSNLSVGTKYYFEVKAVNGTTLSNSSIPASNTTLTTPYSGSPFSIIDGAVLQAENFDNGSNGVAYSDSTPNNSGAANSTYPYRADTDVDVEDSIDTKNGPTITANGTAHYYDVGYIAGNEWLNYTVNVATTGYYNVTFRIAAAGNSSSAGSLDLKDLTTATDLTPNNVTIPGTGGYQNWQDVTKSIYLTSGNQTLQLYFTTGGYNVNYIRFDGASTPFPGPGPFTVTDGAVLLAENFDDGANNLAYSDSDPTNNGGAYRSNTGVDLESSQDSDVSTNDIGWIVANEWVKYTVNVAVAGTYAVTFRVAGPTSGALQLSDESGFLGSANLPNTGGYQNWQDFTISNVTLAAGADVLKVLATQAGYNLDFINFQLSNATPKNVSFTAADGNVTIKHGSTSNQVIITSGSQNLTNYTYEAFEYSVGSVPGVGNLNSLTILPGANSGNINLNSSGVGNLSLKVSGGSYVLNGDIGANVSNLSLEAASNASVIFNSNETLAALLLDAGTSAKILENGNRTLALGALTIDDSNATMPALLDVQDNKVVISNATSAELTAVENQLSAGRTSSTSTRWAGTSGIVSGTASTLDADLQAERYSVGYKITGTDDVPGTLTIQYCLSGDSNLDGLVDLNDLNLVLNHLGSAARWDQGNLDYTATVDLNALNNVLNELGTNINTFSTGAGNTISIDAGTLSSTITVVIGNGSTVTFTTGESLAGLMVNSEGAVGEGFGSSLNISGSASLSGTLAFDADLGVAPAAMAVGESITLLSAAGGITGQFTNVSGLPSLASGTHWQLVYGPTTVSAEVFQDLSVDAYPGSVAYQGVNAVITLAGINDIFNDYDPSAYTVSVDWGDGTSLDTTTGVVTYDELTGDDYQVTGSHTYTVGGSYTPTVRITHISDGDTATIQTNVSVAAAPMVGVSQFNLGNGTHSPTSLTTDANGTLWFIDSANNQLGRLTTSGVLTEFTAPVGFTYTGLAADSYGNVWATQSNGKVAKVASDGTTTAYTVASATHVLADPVKGWDGNIWFTDVSGNSIDEIASDGTVTSFAIPTADSDPGAIVDFDNPMAMAFIEQNTGKVGVIDYNGNVTEYDNATPTFLAADNGYGLWSGSNDQLVEIIGDSFNWANNDIQGMAEASTDGVWFLTSDGFVNTMGHAFSNGTVSYYQLSNSDSNFPSVVNGPGGDAWFIMDDASGAGGPSIIGSVAPDGTVSEFSVPSSVALHNLTVASDGSLWASDAGTNLLTRIVAPAANAAMVIHGHSLTATLGAFSDYFNPSATTGSYTVSVNWGDGTTTAGTVVASSDPNYAFQITGTHTYAAAGTYTTTITLIESDGTSTTLSSWVHVF